MGIPVNRFALHLSKSSLGTVGRSSFGFGKPGVGIQIIAIGVKAGIGKTGEIMFYSVLALL